MLISIHASLWKGELIPLPPMGARRTIGVRRRSDADYLRADGARHELN
jgi:hypothetical protein